MNVWKFFSNLLPGTTSWSSLIQKDPQVSCCPNSEEQYTTRAEFINIKI